MERASRSIVVGFASPSTTLHSEVELVGDKEGSGSFELDSEVGVDGTGVLLAGDDTLGGGSWLTTVVSGCPNIPPPAPPPPLQLPVDSEEIEREKCKQKPCSLQPHSCQKWIP